MPNLSGNPTSYAPPSTILGQVNDSINAGAPALNQVSAQSPNFNPSLQPPANQPMPNKSPMHDFAKGLQPQSPPKNPLQSRADLIVKALTSHLASLDKLLGGQQQ